MVELAYLRSYVNRGRALVKCETGCRCNETVLEGHHQLRNSQVRTLCANWLWCSIWDCVCRMHYEYIRWEPVL